MEEFPEGHVFGSRFRVVARLGKGGMGSVYEAEELATGDLVALKVLSSELVEDARFVERFRREAEATARLEHPNIVRVSEFVQTPGQPALIVMERLRGEPLLARVRRGPLEPKHAVSIATQLTSALTAAHEAGVVHRDLKPANVFLVPLAHGGALVKLLDFGIAKLKESDGYHRLTQTGVLIGTPRYASPEQLMGSKGIDARSDIFSLGVLLYGMLAGRVPFGARGAALLIAIQNEAPPPLASLCSASAAVVAAVETAMEKRPERRHPTMQAFEAALLPGSSSAAADLHETAVASPSGLHARVSRATHGSDPTPARARDAAPLDSRPTESRAVKTRHAKTRQAKTRETPRVPHMTVPRTPARGTPRQALPQAALAAQQASHVPARRASHPHARTSRPSVPDATVPGLRGTAAPSSLGVRVLIGVGILLLGVAVLGLTFVAAGFWFRGHPSSAEAVGRSGLPGGWTPAVDYLPSDAAQELGQNCLDLEYQDCACMGANPLQLERCWDTLDFLRSAAASGSEANCLERIVPRYECQVLAAPVTTIGPTSPEWDAWATLRSAQLGPSCSALLESVCGCEGGDNEACISMQTEMLASPSNDSTRRSLLERCREVPDPEALPCASFIQ